MEEKRRSRMKRKLLIIPVRNVGITTKNRALNFVMVFCVLCCSLVGLGAPRCCFVERRARLIAFGGGKSVGGSGLS